MDGIPKNFIALRVMRLTPPHMEMSRSSLNVIWATLLPGLEKFLDVNDPLDNNSVHWSQMPLYQSITTGSYLLPIVQGQIFAGEDFKAYITASNHQPIGSNDNPTTFAAIRFHLKVELWPESSSVENSSPAQNGLRIIYESQGSNVIRPGGFYDAIANMTFPVAGAYSILCSLTCRVVPDDTLSMIRATLLDDDESSIYPEHSCSRAYRIVAEDPFSVSHRIVPLTCNRKLAVEITLNSKSVESSLTLVGIELVNLMEEAKICTISRIADGGDPSDLKDVFQNPQTIRTYLFMINLVVDNPKRLKQLLNKDLAALELRWRNECSFKPGVLKTYKIYWSRETIQGLVGANANAVMTEDTLDDGHISCKCVKCPGTCELGVDFLCTFEIRNCAVVKTCITPRIEPMAAQRAIIPVGVFPITLQNLDPGISQKIDITFNAYESGWIDVPRIKIIDANGSVYYSNFTHRVLCTGEQ